MCANRAVIFEASDFVRRKFQNFLKRRLCLFGRDAEFIYFEIMETLGIFERYFNPVSFLNGYERRRERKILSGNGEFPQLSLLPAFISDHFGLVIDDRSRRFRPFFRPEQQHGAHD